MTWQEWLICQFITSMVCAAICLVIGLIMYFCTRKQREQHDDEPPIIKRIDPRTVNTGEIFMYNALDWRGVRVDHVITFEDFYSIWLKENLRRCHDFTLDGFQFDEGGSYGLDNTIVSFKTERDYIQYRAWFIKQLEYRRYAYVSNKGRL